MGRFFSQIRCWVNVCGVFRQGPESGVYYVFHLKLFLSFMLFVARTSDTCIKLQLTYLLTQYTLQIAKAQRQQIVEANRRADTAERLLLSSAAAASAADDTEAHVNSGRLYLLTLSMLT